MSSMIPGEAELARKAEPIAKMAGRSPLAQLLHALNQPLTGLQCSMEVALASPRTPEQYARGLREGLELTERMRVLVGAIREVTDMEEEKNEKEKEEKNEEQETVELKTVLEEAVGDLAPVAEVKNVRITLDCAAVACSTARAGRRRLGIAVFRLVESALSLAARGSALLIESSGAAGEAWIRVRWQAGHAPSAFSRPELGLLVAQAGWERVGAVWERERTEKVETVSIRLAGGADSRRHC